MFNMGDAMYEAELQIRQLHRPVRRSLPKPESVPQVSARHSLLSKSGWRMMLWLGDLLVAFGCRLQSRFAIEAGAEAC